MGNTRNGESGFIVKGTPEQNAEAIEMVFSMVYSELSIINSSSSNFKSFPFSSLLFAVLVLYYLDIKR